MDYPEKKLRRLGTYSGLIADVALDEIELPDGQRALREIVQHPGGVVILAVDEAGLAACVRQYRYAFAAHLLELPAGKLERGEDPLAAAQRELSEETGLEADEWDSLGQLYSSPGFSTEVLHLYLARGLHPGAAHPDPGEFLDVLRLPLAELRRRVLEGEIADGKTVAAVLRGAHVLARRRDAENG